jgi:hypothetical protein
MTERQMINRNRVDSHPDYAKPSSRPGLGFADLQKIRARRGLRRRPVGRSFVNRLLAIGYSRSDAQPRGIHSRLLPIDSLDASSAVEMNVSAQDW